MGRKVYYPLKKKCLTFPAFVIFHIFFCDLMGSAIKIGDEFGLAFQINNVNKL